MNTLFNKSLGENEKCVFYFYLKNRRHFLANSIAGYCCLSGNKPYDIRLKEVNIRVLELETRIISF